MSMIERDIPPLTAGDALTEAALRDGHRRLLEAYREFLPALTGEGGDGDELRAAVEFLRRGVGGFARWEHDQLDPADPVAEDTAFEHAFLAAETEALADAVRGRLAGAHEAAVEIRRRAIRIEAALELHVYKVEDRPLPSGVRELPRLSAAVPETVALEEDEIDAALAASYWGVLSTQGEAGPYGVPVTYGVAEGGVYIASGPGRKQANLEREPVGCLTVVRVRGPHDWASVVVEGHVERVVRRSEWSKALRAIHRQRKLGGPLRTEELRRVLGASVYLLRAERRGGRRCGSCEF
jgi:nitroimidazol reductase NimA-like FMN-containing flavoprotein (pyridoxamine 5'-phosphate oxidase superfamily)